MTLYLVRWCDEGTAECLRDDGAHDYSAGDFALLPNVFVTTSVQYAQALVVDALVNDELVDTRDQNDNEVPAEDGEFSWDDEHSPQYAVEFRGNIVAIVHIEPVEPLEPKGGPS